MSTIKHDVAQLLQRKRALTYPQIVEKVREKHPDADTSVKSVAWYASRLRAEGVDVNVKRAPREAETPRTRRKTH